MGYRSQVVIALTKHAKDKLVVSFLRNGVTNTEDFTRYLEAEDDDGNVLFHWDWVKWYDGYPEVALWTNFLDELEWDDYRFVRLGEESNDNEDCGSLEAFNINIIRSINWE